MDDAAYDVPTWSDASRGKVLSVLLALFAMSTGLGGLAAAIWMDAPLLVIVVGGLVALASVIIGTVWMRSVFRA